MKCPDLRQWVASKSDSDQFNQTYINSDEERGTVIIATVSLDFANRYFVKIPEAGKFEFLDSGWMDEVTKGRLRGELSDKQYAERIESIKRFERQLTDNGYLVLKLFFQIGKKEQKKRLEELEGNKDTAWRVGENDWWQNKHYDKCEEVYDKYLTDTNASVAPWYIIDSGDKKWA